MSSENLSFICKLNTSLQMREYPLQYARTGRNLKKKTTTTKKQKNNNNKTKKKKKKKTLLFSFSSSVISAELIYLSIYALRTGKLYFSSGPRVDECILKYSQKYWDDPLLFSNSL